MEDHLGRVEGRGGNYESGQSLQSLAAKKLSQAQAQKLEARLEARLEDLHVWEQKKVKESKAGPKTYIYYLASRREGGKLRNIYPGSSCKMEGKYWKISDFRYNQKMNVKRKRSKSISSLSTSTIS